MKRRRPIGYRRLLTTANHKTSKGESAGYLTGILYLSPADESGVMNTCPRATPECRAACLGKHAGRNVMPTNYASRVWKTQLLHDNRELFLASLRWDIGMIERRAKKLNLKPAVRVNGSSDLPWIVKTLAPEFPNVQFYDYTKLEKPELRTLPNYDITFSYSGQNYEDALHALMNGMNAAVVFDTKKGQPLPTEWHGFDVIDGDQTDLRFLDEKGKVVGLRVKGRAIKQDSCFIQKTAPAPLIQIGAIN